MIYIVLNLLCQLFYSVGGLLLKYYHDMNLFISCCRPSGIIIVFALYVLV